MTSISKNVYIDKLNDIVNKYNNRYHSTIKMKPVDVQSSTYIDSSKEINNKDPKLQIGVLLEYQNIKMVLQKVTRKIGLKKLLWFKKSKTLFCGHMLIVILKVKKLLKRFAKKNCKKQIKKNLELKK